MVQPASEQASAEAGRSASLCVGTGEGGWISVRREWAPACACALASIAGKPLTPREAGANGGTFFYLVLSWRMVDVCQITSAAVCTYSVNSRGRHRPGWLD